MKLIAKYFILFFFWGWGHLRFRVVLYSDKYGMFRLAHFSGFPKFTWKSEFRQNYYRTSFSPAVPLFAARISRVAADAEACGGESGNV